MYMCVHSASVTLIATVWCKTLNCCLCSWLERDIEYSLRRKTTLELVSDSIAAPMVEAAA